MKTIYAKVHDYIRRCASKRGGCTAGDRDRHGEGQAFGDVVVHHIPGVAAKGEVLEPSKLQAIEIDTARLGPAKRAGHKRSTPHTLYTLYPTLYTLHPTPYTLHSTPYTPHLTPFTLHPTPYTLHLVSLHPTPYILHLTPCTTHQAIEIDTARLGPAKRAGHKREKFLKFNKKVPRSLFREKVRES